MMALETEDKGAIELQRIHRGHKPERTLERQIAAKKVQDSIRKE